MARKHNNNSGIAKIAKTTLQFKWSIKKDTWRGSYSDGSRPESEFEDKNSPVWDFARYRRDCLRLEHGFEAYGGPYPQGQELPEKSSVIVPPKSSKKGVTKQKTIRKIAPPNNVDQAKKERKSVEEVAPKLRETFQEIKEDVVDAIIPEPEKIERISPEITIPVPIISDDVSPAVKVKGNPISNAYYSGNGNGKGPIHYGELYTVLFPFTDNDYQKVEQKVRPVIVCQRNMSLDKKTIVCVPGSTQTPSKSVEGWIRLAPGDSFKAGVDKVTYFRFDLAAPVRMRYFNKKPIGYLDYRVVECAIDSVFTNSRKRKYMPHQTSLPLNGEYPFVFVIEGYSMFISMLNTLNEYGEFYRIQELGDELYHIESHSSSDDDLMVIAKSSGFEDKGYYLSSETGQGRTILSLTKTSRWI